MTLGQALITKDLTDGGKIYYTENFYGWYYCDKFAFREEYCIISDDIKIINEYYPIEEENENYFNYYNPGYNISFLTENNKKYAIFDGIDFRIKLDYKIYTNIISKLYLWFDYSYDFNSPHDIAYKPLIFCYEDEIIGKIEPCCFEVEISDNVGKIKKVFEGIEINSEKQKFFRN